MDNCSHSVNQYGNGETVVSYSRGYYEKNKDLLDKNIRNSIEDQVTLLREVFKDPKFIPDRIVLRFVRGFLVNVDLQHSRITECKPKCTVGRLDNRDIS